MSVLAVDVGTSGVRAAVVRPDSAVEHVHQLQVLPSSPSQGFVEFDAAEIARAVLEVSMAALAECGSVDAVGISSQRASTVVWDRATGDPVGPGIGWQDLRTVGYCLALQAQGIRLAPNQSATKLAVLLDIADPDRSRDLCAGTVDSWVAWTLSRGSLHVSDRSNLAVTGLLDGNAAEWDETVLEALRIPHGVLPLSGGLPRRARGSGRVCRARRRLPAWSATSRLRLSVRAVSGRDLPRRHSAPERCSTCASATGGRPSRDEGRAGPSRSWAGVRVAGSRGGSRPS